MIILTISRPLRLHVHTNIVFSSLVVRRLFKYFCFSFPLNDIIFTRRHWVWIIVRIINVLKHQQLLVSHLKRVSPDEPVRRWHDPRDQRHHRVITVHKYFALTAAASAQDRRKHKLIEYAALDAAASLVESVRTSRFGKRLHAGRCLFAEVEQVKGGIMGPAWKEERVKKKINLNCK